MTNPNNAIGTNAAFNGRTSPNALNDILGAFSKGIVSGWTCSPKTGMTVQLGGSASTRDVALAEDNAGNKLAIDNRSGAPVEVTLSGAPSTNNRIDCIVAYVDNPSTGDDSTTDNPTACGIIAVSGTVAANPTAPNDAAIRAAITTDGATGGVAYYVVLATILVGTNVTTIGSGVITQGDASTTGNITIPDGSITTPKLADSSVTSQKVDLSTFSGGDFSYNEQATPFKWVDGKTIYKKTWGFTTAANSIATVIQHGISNLGVLIKYEGMLWQGSTRQLVPRVVPDNATYNIGVGDITASAFTFQIGTSVTKGTTAFVTFYYTKSS